MQQNVEDQISAGLQEMREELKASMVSLRTTVAQNNRLMDIKFKRFDERHERHREAFALRLDALEGGLKEKRAAQRAQGAANPQMEDAIAVLEKELRKHVLVNRTEQDAEFRLQLDTALKEVHELVEMNFNQQDEELQAHLGIMGQNSRIIASLRKRADALEAAVSAKPAAAEGGCQKQALASQERRIDELERSTAQLASRVDGCVTAATHEVSIMNMQSHIEERLLGIAMEAKSEMMCRLQDLATAESVKVLQKHIVGGIQGLKLEMDIMRWIDEASCTADFFEGESRG
mmetsp:Transcript_29377/g.80286  ORF Transcript_29377/g.80286 Transcript_29377/m.80286 type:complete len:290 (-) Transcript_29377:116-985(-)